ncbi:hypothetical protein [Brevibacterium album]|uniref:hypothetical protein n=1 Tax=Brevibacterium album TaxID=417948 RepID=UPI0003FA0688|nr:hypothetical protein [Brevibacterium album]
MNRIEIDENTSLPALPQGFFWRVRHRAPVLHIEARRKLWIGSSVVDSVSLSYREPRTDGETDIATRIMDAADVVYRNSRAILGSERSDDQAAAFVGDYPPKNLLEIETP